ncbi:MAG: hypothetical protein R2705_22640 [Ilumatobacteraceae bacterium]
MAGALYSPKWTSTITPCCCWNALVSSGATLAPGRRPLVVGGRPRWYGDGLNLAKSIREPEVADHRHVGAVGQRSAATTTNA